MGRSTQTFTEIIQRETASWSKFRRGLRKADQEVFDGIFRAAKNHLAENFYAVRTLPFESIIMSIIVEQGKQIKGLENKVQQLESRHEKTRSVAV